LRHKTNHKKTTHFYFPVQYLVSIVLLLILIIGLFIYNTGDSYVQLKRNNKLIDDQGIYDFVNFAFFKADNIGLDKREFTKLNCFTQKYSTYITEFIDLQPDTVLSKQDKNYMKSHIQNRPFLWDENKLINVWCLTPKELNELSKHSTDNYWENYIKKYGKFGFHSFTKPIFNQDQNIVIIEHSGIGNGELASRDIYIFRKVKSKWKLVIAENILQS
jgi:hypothetical protein